MDKKIFILTMEGGGTRGVLQAKFLQLLEEKIAIPTYDLFDFFTGVSIGGIHALILALLRGSGKDLCNLYTKKNLHKIFSKSSWFTFPMVFSPKYDGKGKTTLLYSIFGERTLCSAAKDVLVSTYDFINNKPYFFSTFSRNPLTLHSRVCDIADATSAAPVYFPPKGISSHNTFFIDGGFMSNNGTSDALIEAFKAGYSEKNIKILSLGTGGIEKAYKKMGKHSQKWGAAQWFTKGNLLDKSFTATRLTTVHNCYRLLPENFLHIPFDSYSFSYSLDEQEPERLSKLISYAEEEFNKHYSLLEEFLAEKKQIRLQSESLLN